MTLALLLFTYVLGGVTLLPLAVAAAFFLLPKKPPPKHPEPLRAGEIEEAAQTGLDCFKQGWILVTHEHFESQDDMLSKTVSVGDSHDAKSAYASLYKLVSNTSKLGALILAGASESLQTSPLGAAVAMTNSPGAAPAPPAASTAKPASGSKRHRYYAVLKHGNLFLYKNEKMRDVKHVIVLHNHIVSLWPRSLLEAALFTKYSSIAILKSDWGRPRRLSDNKRSGEWADDSRVTVLDVLRPDLDLPAPPGTIFVYTDLNIDKEDWYFALIRATKTDLPPPQGHPPGLNPAVYAKTLHFDTDHMISLIQALYGTEGQLQLKWFNAIIGRLFLSLQRTNTMKQYLTKKIERKLNKIKTPGFLDKFQITKVDPGKSAPMITFPVLREINPDGDVLVSFNTHYTGGLLIQLATKVNINLGSRFKTREVDVLLSITLEQMTGPMLLKIKSAPSARIWYTYERAPEMSIKIEPVISSRQMSYNIITNTIEKKFKEAIRESLVFPQWDDLVFHHTEDELYRGGVWEKDPDAEYADVHFSPYPDDDRKYLVPTSESISLDSGSILTFDSSERSDPSLAELAPSRSNKSAKLSSTISDISKRLRKPKSNHTIGVDETNCLSDGSVVESPRGLSTASMISQGEFNNNSATLRKIGEWYNKGEKHIKPPPSPTQPYHPPDMISNRRPRKNSTAPPSLEITIPSNGEALGDAAYDFGSELSDPETMARVLHQNRVTGAQRAKTPPIPEADDISVLTRESSEAPSLSTTPVSASGSTLLPIKRSNTTRKPPPPLFDDSDHP